MAGTQIEYKAERRVLHLALTVAALDEQRSSGFVLVVEDTSELLRAQKAAAWHEVARRVAHEIKNPLTPIALCADRIARQLSAARADRRRRGAFCRNARPPSPAKWKACDPGGRIFAVHPFPGRAARCLAISIEVVDNALVRFRGRLDGIRRGDGTGRRPAAGAMSTASNSNAWW